MIKNRLITFLVLILATITLVGCEAAGPAGYNARIGQELAMEIMADNPHSIILDVRTLEEFNEGHIPNAISLPVDEIENAIIHMIPDRGEIILVYCRTGIRSANAAVILVEMGYHNVFDFGGIVDWPGEIITPSH